MMEKKLKKLEIISKEDADKFKETAKKAQQALASINPITAQMQEAQRQVQKKISEIWNDPGVIETFKKCGYNKKQAGEILKENKDFFAKETGILINDEKFLKHWFWKKYGEMSLPEFARLSPEQFVYDLAEYTQMRKEENLKAIKAVRTVRNGEPSNDAKTLKEIFVNEDAYNEAIHALQSVNNPVIDANFNYLLGERQKSAFTAWIDVLTQRGKKLPISIEKIANLLTNEIEGLSISEKTLRTPKNSTYKNTSYKKYHTVFLKKISS